MYIFLTHVECHVVEMIYVRNGAILWFSEFCLPNCYYARENTYIYFPSVWKNEIFDISACIVYVDEVNWM